MLRKYGGERTYRTTFLSGVQWQKGRKDQNAFLRAMLCVAAFFSRLFFAVVGGVSYVIHLIAERLGKKSPGAHAVRGGWKEDARQSAPRDPYREDSEPISVRGISMRRPTRQSPLSMDSATFLRTLTVALVAIGLIAGAVIIPPVTVLAATSTVTLLDEDTGIATEIVTKADSVGELLDNYGVSLGVGDIVHPDRSQPVKNGQEIRIRRAMGVSILADGVLSDLRIQAGTVREALAMAGVAYSADDLIQPSLNATLTPGMEIAVTRVEFQEITETQRLYYQKRVQKDKDMYVGEQEVVQEGKEGEKEVDIRIAYHDGEEYSRQVVNERVIAAAEHLIIKEGTKAKPANTTSGAANSSNGGTSSKAKSASSASGNLTTDTSITGKEYKRNQYWIFYQTRKYEIKKTLSVRATAYTHTGRKTATGVWPTLGTVAVDKTVIPLGTRLYIPGYGICKAQDTGGAIKGDKIDIFFDTYEECVKWGNKSITIYIVGPPIYEE